MLLDIFNFRKFFALVEESENIIKLQHTIIDQQHDVIVEFMKEDKPKKNAKAKTKKNS